MSRLFLFRPGRLDIDAAIQSNDCRWTWMAQLDLSMRAPCTSAMLGIVTAEVSMRFPWPGRRQGRWRRTKRRRQRDRSSRLGADRLDKPVCSSDRLRRVRVHLSVHDPVRTTLARSLSSHTAREMPAAASGGYPRWPRVTARVRSCILENWGCYRKDEDGAPV
jgi:hypothetical protein